MINMNKSVKKVVLSAIFFLCVLAMLLCGTLGNNYFVLSISARRECRSEVEKFD